MDISPQLRQYADRMFAMQAEERRQREEWDNLELPATDFCVANWLADDPLDAHDMYEWSQRGARTALEYELVVENTELRSEIERLEDRVRRQAESARSCQAALAEERQRPTASHEHRPKGKKRNRVVFHVSAKAADPQRLSDEMVSRFYGDEEATFKLTNISIVENEVHAVIEYTVKGAHPSDVHSRLNSVEKVVGPITDRRIEVVEREIV